MAITGEGSSLLRSAWNKKNMQYRKNIFFGNKDNTGAVIWSDWFFAVDGNHYYYYGYNSSI